MMSEEKLRRMLEELYNQETDVESVFDEIACHVDFEEPYEGE